MFKAVILPRRPFPFSGTEMQRINEEDLKSMIYSVVVEAIKSILFRS